MFSIDEFYIVTEGAGVVVCPDTFCVGDHLCIPLALVWLECLNHALSEFIFKLLCKQWTQFRKRSREWSRLKKLCDKNNVRNYLHGMCKLLDKIKNTSKLSSGLILASKCMI